MIPGGDEGTDTRYLVKELFLCSRKVVEQHLAGFRTAAGTTTIIVL